MSNDLSDSENDSEKVEDTSNMERNHVFGTVQPFGCLVGVNARSGLIAYASKNCVQTIGMHCSFLLGSDFQRVFGGEITHALNNAAARSGFYNKSTPVGRFCLGSSEVDISAFASEGTHVLQFEQAQGTGVDGRNALNTLSFLMNEIRSCREPVALLTLAADLLRHITGYDRVIICRLDQDLKGQVIAEAKQHALKSFLGLSFPQWDNPVQTSAILAKRPLWLIYDMVQKPTPLTGVNASLQSLDITLAECWSFFDSDLEYLHKIDVRAAMTLTINIEGELWGVMSFQNRSPRVPAPQLRELVTVFVEHVSIKLSSLMKQAQVDFLHSTESHLTSNIVDAAVPDTRDDEEI